MGRLFITVGVVLVLCGLTTALLSAQSAEVSLPPTISGVVIDEEGPIAGAVVQIQGRPNQTETTENGAFTISGLEGAAPITLTAWSDGYYVGWATVDPSAPDWTGGDAIHISLNPLPQNDHSEYEWFEAEGLEGSASCGLCHREYNEWRADQHSRAATNHRFLTVYTGSDVNGQPGQMMEWGSDGAPLPPDPSKPYFGPGFQLDNPGRAGNCATCHTPVASTSPNTQNCAWSGCHTNLTIERANGIIDPHVMPLALSGDAAEGVSCEFCHKIGEVFLDPETNLPLPDMPGILSYRLFRPRDESEQVFFGTVIDVTRQDSYLPLLSKSEFCAGCHYGIFGGVMGDGSVKDGVSIYNSYGEWLNSPYSDPETGKTCQDCHMPAAEENWFVLAERGGLERDYVELNHHTMPGAADENLLQNSVTLESSAERSGDQIEVTVSITNDQAGHDVPTDSPLRSVMLVLEALDANGNVLEMAEGTVNPDYAGDYSGTPGKTFAKVLRDEWTGEAPTAAFWRPVTILEDNRIAAMATDTSSYTFNAPADAAITIQVRLIFRRAFYELMQQKGWNDPDILMESETLQLLPN